MSKEVSIKQIEANKVNALKWWVKTQEWKEIVSKNAIKHWLTGSFVFLKDEKELYEEIRQVSYEKYLPVWCLEERLVDSIVFYILLLKRGEKVMYACLNNQVFEEQRKKVEEEYGVKNRPYMPEPPTLVIPNLYDEEDKIRYDKEMIEYQKEYKLWKGNVEKYAIWVSDNQPEYDVWALISGLDDIERIQRYINNIENRLYRSIKEYYCLKK